jgi:hypothetical protein
MVWGGWDLQMMRESGSLTGLVGPDGLSLDVRACSGHSSYKIVEGFAGEFKLQHDSFRFYMREAIRK